jgi:hypothetical protein
MAINKWLGTATAVSQVDTYTPADPNTGDIYFLTYNGFDGADIEVSFTVAGTETVAAVTAGLHAAWTASAASGFATSTDGTTELTLTAITAGSAFNVTPSIFDGSGGSAPTLPRVATTKNEGPQDWSSTANWSEGTIPGATAGEDTFVEDSDVDILYGLDQSGAGEILSSLRIKKTYTGKIGWNGATGLVGDYLQLKATTATVGEHFSPVNANGSGRIKIDFGDEPVSVAVLFMANSTDSPKPAFRMLANDVFSVISDIRKGSVGLANDTGEISTIASALISYDTSSATDASLEIGPGVTIDDLKCLGGDTYLKSAAATVTSEGGSLTISGTGAIATLNIDGGAVTPVSTGTITTCTISSGSADFTPSPEARTVTTLTLEGPGLLMYDKDIVTITSKIEPPTGAGRQQIRASKV